MSGTVLVTGGAGFIGSHVVQELLRAGRSVRVLDSLAAHSIPPVTPPGVDFVETDVRDSEAVARALAGCDAVCHHAAKVGLGVNFSDTPAYVDTNAMGAAVLLRAMYESGFQGKLVLASSMVVYGEGRYRCALHGLVSPAPRDPSALAAGDFEPHCPQCAQGLVPEAVDESAASDPRNVYAATKLHQEHLAQCFGRETGVPVIALRYHNVYGPRMPRDTPYAGVAAIFRSALATGRAPRVFEDGRQMRDFVHVRDVARANLLALSTDATGAFNIASGHPHTVGDMARALASACDGPNPLVTGEFRRGDVRHVFASPERARCDLGFTAQVTFEQGMQEFAAEAPAPQLT